MDWRCRIAAAPNVRDIPQVQRMKLAYELNNDLQE